MTIKRRILISNIVVLLLLLALVLFLVSYALRVLTRSYGSYNLEAIGSSLEEGLSVKEFQVLCDNVKNMVKETDGSPEGQEKYMPVLHFLDQTGTLLCLYVDNKLTYPTNPSAPEAILKSAFQQSDTALAEEGNFLYADSTGFTYKETVRTNAGKTAVLTLMNPNLGISKVGEDIGRLQQDVERSILDMLSPIGFFGIIVIIIMNFTLVVTVTNSIMTPLNRLKRGAKMISEGNLDFELNYAGDDELTEVMQSFEEMRRRLSESTAKQKKYEEDRKELIAGISHDLRTPLTSIKGYVSGLLDGIADSPEKQEQYLRTVYNTATEMDHLVDDLFLFSKLDLHKIPFCFETVDFVRYLENCCEELAFDLEKKRVILTFVSQCAGPVFVRLDRTQFVRVLLNISNNTVKYKKDDIGSLCVSVSEQEGMVCLALKDDGEGMPREATDKIFESFYRNDPARSNPVKGSGLGLSIAKQIVEAHGGTIYAESNVGEGMTITIQLPVRKDPGGKQGKVERV